VLRFIVFSLPLFVSTASADQRLLVDSYLPSDFVPATVTTPTNSGFWALGTSDGLATLIRYYTNSTPQYLRYPDMQNMLFGQNYNLIATSDGGVLSTDIEDTDIIGDQACKLRRFDADGNYEWTSDLVQPGGVAFEGPACSNVYADGTGTIWLYPAGINETQLIALNPDGTQGPQFDRPDGFSVRAAADPTQSAVYVAGATGSNSTNSLATIWKYTSQGVQWSASAPAVDVGSVLRDIAVGTDGSLWAFGYKGTNLFGMHVDSDGTLLWAHAFTTAQNPADVRVAARADGGASTLHWDTTAFAPELSTFSLSGSRLWHTSSGFSLANPIELLQLNLVAGADGDVVAGMLYESGSRYLQQTRLNSSGVALYKTQPQAQPTDPIANTFSLTMYPDDSSLTAAGFFQHLSRNGVALAAPVTSAVTSKTSLDASALLGPEGSAYLVATNASSKLVGVSAYSNSGTLLWHRSIASSWNNGGLQGSVPLLLRSSDVCVAGDLDDNEVVQCFALADGTPSPQLVLGPALSSGFPYTQAKVTNTGQIVLLYSAADGVMHHVLIDSSGNLLHNTTPLQSGEVWGGSGQNAAGETAIVTSTSSLLELAANGSRAYSVSTDTSFNNVALSDDGTAILIQYNSPPLLERVDTAGQKLWQTAMPSGPYGRVISPRFTTTDLYCTAVGSNIIFGGGQPVEDGLVAKVSLTNGAVEWTTPFTYVFGNWPTLVIDPSGNDVLMLSGWGNSTQVRDYATTDGAELGGKFESCDVDQCALFRAIVAPDGTVRMVNDTTDYVSGSEFQLTTMQKEFDKIFADSFGG
jgi:hypothetical protein